MVDYEGLFKLIKDVVIPDLIGNLHPNNMTHKKLTRLIETMEVLEDKMIDEDLRTH